jgi:hypothetical protein
MNKSIISVLSGVLLTLTLLVSISFISISQVPSSCDAPLNVNVTNISFNTAVVSWDTVPDAFYYRVSYKKSTQANWYSVSTTSTSRTLYSLTDTCEYYLKVQTYCGYGSYSNWTPVDTFWTLSGSSFCSLPTNIQLSNITNNKATLSWDAVTGAYYYKIHYRKTTQANWYTTSSSSLSRTLNGLSQETEYEYKLQSYCGYGLFSNWTAIDTFSTLSVSSMCGSPGNVLVDNITHNSAVISWDSVSTASFYMVKYKKTSQSYWYTTSDSGLSKNLQGLSQTTDYEFKVQSYCGYGLYSDWSPVDTFTTLSGSSMCGTPINISVDNITHNSATISWDTVGSASYYKIQYKKTSQTYWYNATSSYTYRNLSWLSQNTEYEFKVQSYCAYGLYSDWSPVDTFTTLSASSMCATPINISVDNITHNSATINWDTVASVSYYKIQYKKTSQSYWYTATSSYTYRNLTWLSQNTEYEYKVQSYCGYGLYSDWSPVDTFTTLSGSSMCATPINMYVNNITHNSATINWDTVATAYYYKIQYKQTSQSYWYTASGSYTYRNLSWLTQNTEYEYKVQAYCGYGLYSDWSPVDTFTTVSGSSMCAIPSNISISNVSYNTATLSWDVVPAASYYKITYKETTQSSWYTTYSSLTTRSLNGLSDTSDYEYKIQSYCGYSLYSDWSPVDTFTTLSGSTICSTPQNITVDNITHNSATVNWNLVAGASYYKIRYKKTAVNYWYTTTSSYAYRNLTGLSQNTDYEYMIQSFCGSGLYSDWSSVDTFTTLSTSVMCPTPANVIVSNIGNSSATFNWDTIPGANYYKLKYRRASQNYWSSYTSYNPEITLNYLYDTTLYYYQLQTYCGPVLYSDLSPVDSFLTLSNNAVCGIPGNIMVSNISYNAATITWDSIPGAYYYLLQYKKTSSSYWSTSSCYTNEKELSYLSDTTEYQIQVKTYCNYGLYSSYSPVGSFTTLSVNTVCAPPSNLLVSNVTNNSASLSWDAVPAVYNYQIKYRKSTQSYWSSTSSYTTQKDLTYLSDTTLYYVQIKTYCGSGLYSDLSPVDSFTTLSNASVVCSLPANITLSNITQSGVTVSWDLVAGATNYYIKYKIPGQSYWSTTSSAGSSKTITWMSPITNYELFVLTQCGYGVHSDTSQIFTFTTLSGTKNDYAAAENINDIRVYPNPTKGWIMVDAGDRKWEYLALYDLQGRKLATYLYNSDKQIHLENINAGMYVLRFYDKHALIGTRKLILQ